MRAQDRKLRLALAVFEPGVSLEPAVAALLHEGVPLSRIGLVLRAEGSGFDLSPFGATKASPEAGPLRTLATDLRPISQARESDPILASPRLLDPWRSGWHLPALWADQPSAANEPRLAPDLERHVKSGAVIVAVETLTPREQWQCMRVLLQQCSSTVLALECSMSPPATEA
jgi:hypothetical protein